MVKQFTTTSLRPQNWWTIPWVDHPTGLNRLVDNPQVDETTMNPKSSFVKGCPKIYFLICKNVTKNVWNQIKLFLNRSNINRGYCNMYNRRLYLGTIVNLQDACKPSSQWLFSLQFKWLGERHEGTIPEALFLDVAMDDITPK